MTFTTASENRFQKYIRMSNTVRKLDDESATLEVNDIDKIDVVRSFDLIRITSEFMMNE